MDLIEEKSSRRVYAAASECIKSRIVGTAGYKMVEQQYQSCLVSVVAVAQIDFLLKKRSSPDGIDQSVKKSGHQVLLL